MIIVFLPACGIFGKSKSGKINVKYGGGVGMPKIIIAVLSCHAERHLHQQIRDTWAKDAGVDVRFFLGAPVLLNTEDEIFLSVPDDFDSVSLKTEASIEWAHSRGYEFRFKCDTDSYVYIPRLLASGFERYDYSGLRYPYSDLSTIFNKNERSEAYGGTGYWLSRRAMEYILSHKHLGGNRKSSEDHWVGAILKGSGLSNFNDKRYHDSSDGPAPENNYITCHHNWYGPNPKLWTKRGALKDSKELARVHHSASKIGLDMKVLVSVYGWLNGATNGEFQAMRDTVLKDTAKYPGLEYRFFLGDGTPTTLEEKDRLLRSFRGYEREYLAKARSSMRDAGSFSYVPKDDEVVLHVPDDYLHTSYKTQAAAAWAVDRGFDYIFGCFSDTYINLKRLMESDFEKYPYSGMQCGGYAAGGPGYWIDRASAQKLVSETVISEWAEDRWVGDVMRKHGIECHYDPRYVETPALPQPGNDFITSHLAHTPTVFNPQMLYDAHRAAQVQVAPQPIPARRPRYAADGQTQNWWDRHPRR